MSRKKLLVSVVLVAVLLGVAAFLMKEKLSMRNSPEAVSQKEEKPLEKVKVQAGWILNGEFASICSAIVKGYYKDEGLDVQMVPGGPTGASFTLATNAIAQDDSLTLGVEGDLVPLLRGVTKEATNEKLRVKAFASLWNDSPYGFIVRKDTGIHSLKDFANRKPNNEKYKIGVTSDAVIQNAIADYIGVPVSALDIKIVGFDATPFLAGQVDAMAGFLTSLAYDAEKAGIDYEFLPASEIPGFRQPTLVAEATDKVLETKKDTLEHWLRGTIRGINFVKNQPTTAGQQVLDERCGGKGFNADQETWLINKSLPLYGTDKLGWINENQVMDFAKTYAGLKQIPRVPAQDEILDYSILQRIYPQ